MTYPMIIPAISPNATQPNISENNFFWGVPELGMKKNYSGNIDFVSI